MHEEREKIPFENKYYDQNSYDPTTITNESIESIDQYMIQYGQYEANLNNRVGEVLSPEQSTIFKSQMEQSRNMQTMGLKMAADMFGK